MSFTAARVSRRTRALCQQCLDRKARFQARGGVRADRDHTLCFECFRVERERQRARTLAAERAAPGLPFLRPASERSSRATDAAAGPAAPHGEVAAANECEVGPAPVAGAPATPSERRLAHRRTMLAHLEREHARRASTSG